MKKKIISVMLVLLLLFSTSIFASGAGESKSEVTKIRFYGSDAEYNRNIIAMFEAENPDIKVEIVPVDFDNAEQVIKTGIASNNPVDVSFFWGAQIKSFVTDGMALDLTPYLTADNNAWLDTFVPAYIDAGKIDGKYYAVSYQPVIETVFINKDLFEQYGLELPTTVDEMLEVSAEFAKHGIYGIGCWTGQNHQLLPWTYQIYAKNGVLEDATTGKLPLDATPGLKEDLEIVKNFYDKGYWYPGEGALTATKEQVQAAFYQGKIAMLFDAASNAGTYEQNADFEIDVIKTPLVEEGNPYTVNVVTNALFIPANAKHPEEAVKFIQFYTTDAAIEEIIKSGRLPSTKSMQDAFDDPVLVHLMTNTEDAIGYQHLQNLSSEMASYLQNDIVSSVCSGIMTIDEAVAHAEELRLKAVEK